MGFRFRKSIKVGKGFRINLSKSGVGYSFGTKGVRFTKTATGKSRSTMSIPGTGISYTTESSRSNRKKSNPAVHTASASAERSNAMKWVDFILCFFFGCFGVHKFRERRIGLGLVYLFTCGLFGIGWFIDCIKYLIAALKPQQSTSFQSTNDAVSFDSQEFSADSKSSIETVTLGSFIKKHWRWILVAFLGLLVLATIPSFFGILALLVIAIIIPIEKWQLFLDKYLKRKIRNIIAGVFAVLALFTFPSGADQELPDVTEPAVIIEEETEPAHIHEFIDASCSAPKTCSSCGETEGEPLGHSWVDATCTKLQYCSVCNEEFGELADHTWESATCLSLQTCTVCQITEGELADHTWVEATCLAPKTCSVCEITEGDIVDHSWEAATCEKPKTCSVCSLTKGNLANHTWEKATCQAPKTCSVCGTTTGNLANHTWEKATCQTLKTCSVCGEETGEYVDCKYKNGECIYCGDSEPTVWIPRSGRKYHDSEYCSGMDDPKEVTISTAKARGFTPCKRCF